METGVISVSGVQLIVSFCYATVAVVVFGVMVGVTVIAVILVVVVSVIVCRIVTRSNIAVGLMSTRIGGDTSILFILIVIIIGVDNSDIIVLNGWIVVSGFQQKKIIHCQFAIIF